MSEKLHPFIWLNHDLKEVFDFYSVIFSNSKIKNLSYSNGAGFSGTMEILGQDIIFLNGGPYFVLNPSFSLMIDCEDQNETDYYWEKLALDGGQEGRCGWCVDKFGLSWQVTPKTMLNLLSHSDAKIAEYAHGAMMKMGKIIISDLSA